ncbi:hypothetical protein ACJIZ3_024161 [Penstemon smallii]|uniref:Uncharacterized protein n=1 Tax=Penstemon smallii TaxID=265156 RepID=A0ABD3TR79_9LAMI
MIFFLTFLIFLFLFLFLFHFFYLILFAFFDFIIIFGKILYTRVLIIITFA